MVYIGSCEFCGRRNINPPSSDFFFVCLHGRTIVSCVNENCKVSYCNAVAQHELKTQTFSQYEIYGASRNIRIPRSDGSVSEGVIAYENGLPPMSSIRIRENNIMFYIEFTDNNDIKCKHVSFSELSRINTHLPLVKMNQSNNIALLEKQRLEEFQEQINNYCVLTNKATRLIIMSYIKSSGTFSILPREIISIILAKYYQ